MEMQIVSLFDCTGEALTPWAEAGYECYAYDIQHTGAHRDGISFLHADLHDSATVRMIVERHAGKVRLVSAFPVCTDLAASGACWWAGKREAENPVGALSRLWRKPDHVFDPCEYGGYLSETDKHPLYPQHIPPCDAYRKKTCIWHGPGFTVPPKRPVEPLQVVCARKRTGGTCRYAPQAAGLGGRSQRTKIIRSATRLGEGTPLRAVVLISPVASAQVRHRAA